MPNIKKFNKERFSNKPTLSIFNTQISEQFCFLNFPIKLRYIFKNITINRYISKYILPVKKRLWIRIEVDPNVYLLSGREI